MKSNLFNKLFLLLSAFTLTSNVLVAFFEASGNETIASFFGAPLLAIVTIVSIVKLAGERQLWIPSVLTTVFLIFLVWFQSRHDVFNTSEEFIAPFLVHGLGGFFMGLAITDHKSFIKYISIISFVYLLFLITEPINRQLLGGEAMRTGYVITSLIVLLILAYFTTNRRNLPYLALALIMSILVTIFTSRGCGLTIVLTWLFFILWGRAKNGYKIRKAVIRIIICSVVLLMVFPFVAEKIMTSSVDVSDGSLVYKYMGGEAGDSNGRSDIWALGIAAISQNWMTGMGFGADRAFTLESTYVHDIFLELFIDFGIPLALMVLFFYWRPIVSVFKAEPYSFSTALIVALIIRSWGQLLFSNSYLANMLVLMYIYGICLRIYIDNKSAKQGDKVI